MLYHFLCFKVACRQIKSWGSLAKIETQSMYCEKEQIEEKEMHNSSK